MRVRRFLLTVALAATLTPGLAVRADLNYRAEITGAEDSDLAGLLDKVSELKTLEDKPPASEEALRGRADRDLGRLEDAAHSLGYWDAEFSYEVDTEAEPAKVTVKAEPGPLYHVGSVTVQGPDGRPLDFPNQPKLPLKPGMTERLHRSIGVGLAYNTLAITGLERLEPGYVEGRIRWKRGAVYDEAKVEETRRALIASGLFSTVRITPQADCQRRWETRPHAGARVGQFRAVFSDGRAWVSALARALAI
jgi:translocation and assembly module TamA